MKGFLKPKLIFIFVAMIMLASIIVVPLISGSIRHSHAAAPKTATTSNSTTFVNDSCRAAPHLVGGPFNANDQVSVDVKLTTRDQLLDEQNEPVLLWDLNGLFQQSLAISNGQASNSKTFPSFTASSGDEIFGCIDGEGFNVEGSSADEAATVIVTTTPVPVPVPTPTPPPNQKTVDLDLSKVLHDKATLFKLTLEGARLAVDSGRCAAALATPLPIPTHTKVELCLPLIVAVLGQAPTGTLQKILHAVETTLDVVDCIEGVAGSVETGFTSLIFCIPLTVDIIDRVLHHGSMSSPAPGVVRSHVS